MRQKRFWIVGLALALVLALVLSQPTYADDITVDTTNDVLDAAGGICNDVTIDSLPGPDGLISLREAICAANKPGPDTINFNITGCSGVCTIQPTSVLPTLTDDGTTIDGYTQPGAAQATATTSATLKIEIDGTNAGSADGLHLNSSNNSISGLVINRFGRRGVLINGSGVTGNVISGNYIGTDASGVANRGNAWAGVGIYSGAQSNTVGGDTDGERNVISGNAGGVDISGGTTMTNTVSGNYIGVAADGTTDLGNNQEGVFINANAQNNTIGGDTDGERNVISGNGGSGVRISDGAEGNTVSGNYIGTDEGGTLDRSNTWSGVFIGGGAQNNTVGGDTAGERNIISGNGSNGVYIWGSGTMSNTVSGNYIGLAADGTTDLGNANRGVYIVSDAQNNTVGPGNVIAYSGYEGVEVNGGSTTGNTITQNSIFSNTMGIELTSGANGGISAPVIATTTVGSVNIVGTACANCTVEVFENSDTDGEGETYVGDTTATATGDFTVTVSSLSEPYLTATATDATDGTSEFSDVFMATVTGGGSVYLPIILKSY